MVSRDLVLRKLERCYSPLGHVTFININFTKSGVTKDVKEVTD
jgi:hypothetical protein